MYGCIVNALDSKIFKNIQSQREQGNQVEVQDIGIKETPYHKLLMEEEKRKHIVKRKDFTDNLNIERRFANTVKKNRYEKSIYKKLEKELSPDRKELLKIDESDIFEHTRSHTIEPTVESIKHQDMSIANSIFKSLTKLNKDTIQSHLKRLNFTNGRYLLNKSDSSKRFSERPLNEIYSGKLLK
jgi:hypothetical protein